MKALKFSLTLLIPGAVAGLTFAGLMAMHSHFNGLFSHDIYESHRTSALAPFMAAISFFIAFLPSLFYVADLMYKPRQMAAPDAQTAAAILTTAPALTVGQVYTSAGANCQLRVKALKNSIFANADFSQYTYCLQFSY